MNEFFKANGDIYFTTIILVITIVTSLYANKHPYYKSKWIFNAYAIRHRKEFYRFLSSGFIHGDAMHLIFNMLSLYFFARQVENIFDVIYPGFGSYIFLAIYLLAIILSSIPAYIKYSNDSSYNALGASGGVSAIVFISILCFPTQELMFILLPIPIPGFILGAGYILYSYYMAKNGNDNIGHEAHLAGSVVGIIAVNLLIPNIMKLFFDDIARWALSF